MRSILVLLILALLALVAQHKTESRRFSRKQTLKLEPLSLKSFGVRKNYFPDFDDDESEWTFGRRKLNRRLKRKYTRLMLNRQMFYYWNHNYEKWTNWTDCSPKNCTKTRFRMCKDNSWEEYVKDFRWEKKCPVKYIYERKLCNDTKECVRETKSWVNNNIYSLPENCGVKPVQIENKIYGGRETNKNAWPWHVGLYVNTKYRSFYICGGTLINPGWVVTAAHCLNTVSKVTRLSPGEIIDTKKQDLYKNFHVIIGDHDRSKASDEEITRKISHFIIHEYFKISYTSNLYDIALLKLEEPIPNNTDISFACVPKSNNYSMETNDKCFAIGWGDTGRNDPYDIWSFEFDFYLEKWRKNRRQPKPSSILQEVEVPLVDFEKCERKYRAFNLDKNIHICAGSEGKDTCRGDSGGGLFCQDPITNRWQLYGITNFGQARGCGVRDNYGVYIRVPQVADWIRKIIKQI